MREVLITSTVLIAALLILRRIFRETLSRRVQYALWGLVLLRLLVPASLPAADFSVLTAARPIQETVAARAEVQPVSLQRPDYAAVPNSPQSAEPVPEMQIQTEQTPPAAPEQSAVTVRESTRTLSLSQVLDGIWKAGMLLTGLFFLLSNLRFWRRLRRCRRPYLVEGTSRRVYLVGDGVISSPCLFGLFRPAVYLTPAAVSSGEALRHVMAHEETHARHLDPLWGLLRCVCLAVYWFDPLVWVAAACSKTDCELACDEGALARLGEEQRIPYGQTLLALIPVRSGPGNPFLTATTMAARKKQIKNRITRIAQKPRQLVAAAVAVVVLAAGVSACTFTGAANDGGPDKSEDVALEMTPLTGEQLRFFNEEWFNGEQYNIRNQFLSSTYEAPEDIDLFGLFYCEGSTPSREEIRTILNSDPDGLPCPAYKLTRAEADEILTEYLGLTLDETKQTNMGTYTYDAASDAWYWMHGDTNYRSHVEFTCGVHNGREVRLYYYDSFLGGGWMCVTLLSLPGDRYQFSSNVPCGKPAVPTPLPGGDPAAVISLTDLEPYPQTRVILERHTGDFTHYANGRVYLENWDFDGHNVVIYRSTDGNLYAAERLDDETMDVFLTVEDGASMFFFHDLFGHDGFTLDYEGRYSSGTSAYNGPIRDYYYFDEDGTLILLARCGCSSNQSAPRVMDLDGDGTNELCAPWQLFFERDGAVYEARLEELVLDVWPELRPWSASCSVWDPYAKCLTAWGTTEYDEEAGPSRDWTRQLYFDGENLLVYKANPTPTSADGADKNVPAEVVSAAKEYVLSQLEEQADGTWLDAGWRNLGEAHRPTYDDWRVESFGGPYSYEVGSVTVEAWSFNYECHTTTPKKVVLAGGRYLTEDDWVSPGYPGCDWLFFRLENGNRVFLWHAMINDMSPDSVMFQKGIEEHLQELGVDMGTTYAALQAQWALDAIMDTGGQVLLSLSTSAGGGGSYTVSPDAGNGRFFQNWFTEPNSYRWTQTDPPAIPTGDTLIIAEPDWYRMLQFWAGSDLVMIKETNREPVWYRAETLEDPDSAFYERAQIYNFLRQWYDEAELAALRQENTVPDSAGQSRQDIARAWAMGHECAMLSVTPGSCFRCTYVNVTDVEVMEDMPEDWFSAQALASEHYAFRYTAVFVPADENVLHHLMAGNTGAYTGNDPAVPEGAFEYYLIGSMYRTQDGWRCDGVGTG
ncbi:MAG: M56 family metallopeptidase [Oscillospiraceae bacterium]